MKKKFAVFGNPIEHSKSPQIHQEFANDLGINLEYHKILVEGDLQIAINNFRASGGVGGNITVPFKEKAFALAGLAHSPALLSGAANTIWWGADETLIVNNTDGVGLVRDICQNLKFNISGCNILILGAGGACAGIIAPLLGEKPRAIDLVNRTLAKAEKLVAKFNLYQQSLDFNCQLRGISLADFTQKIPDKVYDIIINTSSAGLTEVEANLKIDIPESVFHKNTFAYDLIYGKQTPLIKFAQRQNLKFADGWGMLVEQAAEAFFIWHHQRPNTFELINKKFKL